MQKFSIIIFFFLLGLSHICAQSDITPANITATAWSNKYQLDEAQQAKALRIAQRKHEQLESIAALMTTNPEKYYAKLDAVQKGTLASIERILNTPEQVKIYQATQAETRRKRAEIKRSMKSAGATKSEIKKELVRVHAE